MKSLVWILCLGLGCLLSAGCSKSTDAGGGGDSAEKGAIARVLEKDRAARIEAGFGKIADSMRTIDLKSCPPRFREAYQKHISAWEKNDLRLIDETFEEVKRIAREYGVDVSPFE
jgi:hypothetical protein